MRLSDNWILYQQKWSIVNSWYGYLIWGMKEVKVEINLWRKGKGNNVKKYLDKRRWGNEDWSREKKIRR